VNPAPEIGIGAGWEGTARAVGAAAAIVAATDSMGGTYSLTSAANTLPPGPVPGIVEMSWPVSFASLKAKGEALVKDDDDDDAEVLMGAGGGVGGEEGAGDEEAGAGGVC